MKRNSLLSIALVLLLSMSVSCYLPVVASASNGPLTFELNPNGNSYYVKDCDFTAKGDIVIPSTYKNKPVTTIGQYAFEYCDEFDSLTIPTSIKYVGSHAFNRAYAYADIYYKGNADQWASISFQGTAASPLPWPNTLYLNGKKAVNISFSDSLEEIKPYAFYRCLTLETVKFGKNIKKIGDFAFSRNDNIQSVTLPEGLKEIGSSTFSSCINMKSISIPQSVTQIDGFAFRDCKSLTSIDLPDGLTTISIGLFCECESITSVRIPDSVTSIGEQAFDSCKNLVYVVLPKNLSSISMGAFSATYSLKYLYYQGSEEEFSNIYNADPYCFDGKTIYYNVPIVKKLENVCNGVKISWNKVSDATAYRVYRRGAGEKSWTYITTTKDNFFVDKNVKNNAYYRYTLRATNNNGLYSNYYPNSQYIKYVEAPKLTSINNATSGIYISWTKLSNATSYIVYRRGAGQTTWDRIGTTVNLWFVDKSVVNSNGNYYRYSVVAKSGFESGLDTKGLVIKRLANPGLVSAVSSQKGITVKWNVIEGTTGYYVYRKTPNSNWVRLAAVGGTNNTTYLDKTAQKGVKYTYTVRACYGYTLSSFSAGITCTDKY